MKTVFLALLGMVFIGSCTTHRYAHHIKHNPQDEIFVHHHSLFDGVKERLKAPNSSNNQSKRVSLAIYNHYFDLILSKPAYATEYFWYKEEIVKEHYKFSDTLHKMIQAFPNVGRTFELPRMLLDTNYNILDLERIAEYCGASHLLVYSVNCDLDHKANTFGTDQFKIFCELEAIVVNVSDGSIPFTTRIHDFKMITQEKGMTVESTIQKGEELAVEKTLTDLRNELQPFLGSLGNTTIGHSY